MGRSEPLTLLAIFAHPDDELSMGGTLARCAAEGVQALVACATRGDGPDAKISDPRLASRETLGQVRSEELRSCLQTLGLGEPLFLGLRDGGIDEVDPEAATRALVRLIRERRPQVVVTHGPEGGYGHPDHIALSALVTQAWERADDPALAPEGPVPFGPAKLYYTAMPRSLIARLPALAARRADIRGQQLAFVGVPDELITTVVDVAAQLERKDAARACHRTQFGRPPAEQPAAEQPAAGQPAAAGQTAAGQAPPGEATPEQVTTGPAAGGLFAGLPEAERRALQSRERFVLARTRRPAMEIPESDLFAGLRGR
jgi:LmbE family N-acetylglucosaminyl deacetylase